MRNYKELTGIVKNKKLNKIYRKNSQYRGNTYWRLKVKIDEKEQEILVFKEFLERKNIWEEIESWELKQKWDKLYYFKVERKSGAGQVLKLIDWKELKNDGSD